MVMQAMWMVMVTLVLGLSRVLGLALATHCHPDQAPVIHSAS
jgi:hypothetical protein